MAEFENRLAESSWSSLDRVADSNWPNPNELAESSWPSPTGWPNHHGRVRIGELLDHFGRVRLGWPNPNGIASGSLWPSSNRITLAESENTLAESP